MPVGLRCVLDILAMRERLAPWATPCNTALQLAQRSFLCFFPLVIIRVALAVRRKPRSFRRSDLDGILLFHRHCLFFFEMIIIRVENVVHNHGDEEAAQHVEPEPVSLRPYHVERVE